MKKDVPTILLIGIAGISFAIVSFLVLVSLGKSSKLINWKLKLGAWLITLSTVVNTGCPGTIVTCYEPAILPNEISINENMEASNYVVNTKLDSLLNFNILYANVDTLTYKIKRNNAIEKSGFPILVEGSLSSHYADYYIKVDDLQVGEFQVELFGAKLEQSSDENLLIRFSLQIINE